MWDSLYNIGDELKVYYDHRDVDMYLPVILSHSLTKAMDKAKKVIFIASDNTITMGANELFNKTYSPWIFHELSMLNLLPSQEIKSRMTSKYRASENVIHFSNNREIPLKMEFNVKLPAFIDTEIDLESFINS